MSLLGSQDIDPGAHRFKFETGNLVVNISRHGVGLLLQLVSVLRHVISRQNLVSAKKNLQGIGRMDYLRWSTILVKSIIMGWLDERKQQITWQAGLNHSLTES